MIYLMPAFRHGVKSPFPFDANSPRAPGKFALGVPASKKPRVPNHGVLAVRVANLGQKDVMLRAEPAKFFTEPHYDGYPAVLVRLSAVSSADLKVLLAEAWRCQAPVAPAAGAKPAKPTKPAKRTKRGKSTKKTAATAAGAKRSKVAKNVK